jgi:ribonuclease R
LGDRIKVRVAAVNMEDRKIDFVLDDGNSEAPTKKKVEMIHGVPADQLRIDRPPRSQPGSKKPSKNPWGSRSESDEKKTSKKKASKGKKRKGRPGKKERAAAKASKGKR